jgi:hypothetical protein
MQSRHSLVWCARPLRRQEGNRTHHTPNDGNQGGTPRVTGPRCERHFPPIRDVPHADQLTVTVSQPHFPGRSIIYAGYLTNGAY